MNIHKVSEINSQAILRVSLSESPIPLMQHKLGLKMGKKCFLCLLSFLIYHFSHRVWTSFPSRHIANNIAKKKNHNKNENNESELIYLIHRSLKHRRRLFWKKRRTLFLFWGIFVHIRFTLSVWGCSKTVCFLDIIRDAENSLKVEMHLLYL